MDFAEEGDDVGLLLRDIKREDVQRGQVLAMPDTIFPHKKFWVEVSDEVYKQILSSPNSITFFFRTIDVGGKIVRIDPNILSYRKIVIELISPVALEKKQEFGILKQDSTIGIGTIIDFID